MKNRFKLEISLVTLIFLVQLIHSIPVLAQLNQLGASYYQNPYLFNPAMAGREEDAVVINAGLTQRFSTFPGAPVTQAATLGYGMTNKAGIGAMVLYEAAGVLKRIRATGTFAYHLPLNGADQKLHFGISLSVVDDRLDNAEINGDQGDPDLIAVNQRESYLDGDFGIAFTTNNLTIEGALPNMKRLFKQDLYKATGAPTFFSGVSYRMITSFGSLQPKVIYRGIKGFDNLLDAGIKAEFETATENNIHFTALYHDSKSATFGFGMDFKKVFSFIGLYTTNTSAMQGYTNGNFEVGITYKIGKN